MDLERRYRYGYGYENGNGNGNNGFMYDVHVGLEEEKVCDNNEPRVESLKVFPLSSSTSSSSFSTSSSSNSPPRYIQHHVTKLDTLVGVAIKYGVEVADIKRLNGLISDIQIFARNTILIPQPGKHPPSSYITNDQHITRQRNCEETTSRRRGHSTLLDSFQSLRTIPDRKFSPAMSHLQGYYGLKGDEIKSCDEDEALKGPLSKRSKSMTSFSRGKYGDEFVYKKVDKSTEKCIGKNTAGGWFSSITWKGLALRKSPNRTNSSLECQMDGSSEVTSISTDSYNNVITSTVRKSYSTPSLQYPNQNNNNGSSIWSWALRPDLQIAITIPIFDGFAKPIACLRTKTALD